MILTDTGPLVAILRASDRNHGRCASALARESGPMITTWPVFTEAMYLLHSEGGWPAQDLLWSLAERGDLEIRDLDAELRSRCRQLMRQYRNVPMDLADATLVALAESLRVRRIFTLDSDFRVYRPTGRGTFDIVPE